ncbi:MAG: ribonuclease III [Lachnospiraceae bacterium]|nr:ribonuclease III [Lachnospiraceae bacterium]
MEEVIRRLGDKVEMLENSIHYTFKDKNLLYTALTHSSYANERKGLKPECNERLEFLGDAVLELASSKFLFLNHPDMQEGLMTKLRASLVCEPTLAACARQFGLGDYLLLGKGEALTGGRRKESLVSDALEALIGAIYLDSGFEEAEHFILEYVLNDIDKKKLFYDAKTILQEKVQALEGETLTYELLAEIGPDHDKSFRVAAKMGGKTVGIGEGRTKKAAEQQAAYQALIGREWPEEEQ